ncbi:hypothetical protein ACFPIJ_38510 [Dactylosporangium cerinum]|uniref:Uncharacterized protein n=1 Tax=Dactylosporangium cerinum TaxID=1434730 RepID=A0ABV9W6R5_9ACTN
MDLTFSGERQVRQFPCQCCESTVDRTWSRLNRDGVARAVFYASCYHHAEGGEVYFDIVIGTWDTEDLSDHVTFGCRWGAIEGHDQPMCSLTTGGEVLGDNPLFGTKLDRPAALQSPLLPEFWDMVDFLLLNDPVVAPFVNGHRARLR